MCKPSCCTNRDSGSTGLTAIAVLLVAVFLAVKIAPAIVEIGRVVLDAIRIAAISLASAIVLAAISWLAIRLLAIGRRHRKALAPGKQIPVAATTLLQAQGGSPGCIACGGDGHVLQANRNGSFQVRACPECQPAQLAG